MLTTSLPGLGRERGHVMRRKALAALGLTGAVTGARVFGVLASRLQEEPTPESVQDAVTALGQQTTCCGSSSAPSWSSSCRPASPWSRPASAGPSTPPTWCRTNFAIFGLGFVGFFLVGYALDVRRLQLPAARLRLRRSRSASALIGSRRLGLPVEGRLRPRRHGGTAAPARRSASSSTWSPSWTPWPRSPPAPWPSAGSGTSFVGWGLFCGAIYYPLFGAWTWGGGWLAKLGNTHGPRRRLRRLRRLRRRARRRRRGRPRRRHRARSPHRQVRQGRHSQRACPATTSRWPCSARSSCCSAGSASTPRRRSRPPTCSSPSWPTNTAIAGAFGAVVAMFWIDAADRQARPRA